MYLKYFLYLFLFTLSTSLNASIVVDWTSTHRTIYSFGQFAGDDLNNNQILEFEELTSFSFYGTPNNVDWVNDFGDFHLTTSTWVPNAITSPVSDPGHDPDDLAYFSYNEWVLAFRPSIGTINWVNVTGYTPSPVPVPAAVWLFGSGLAGLLAFTRRRKSW